MSRTAKKRGRKARERKVEVECLYTAEAGQKWDDIFALLEAGKSQSAREEDLEQPIQLTLFE